MRPLRVIILILLILVITVGGVLLALNFARGGTLLGGAVATQVGAALPDQEPVQVTATPEPVLQILAAAQNLNRGTIIPTEALVPVPWPTTIVPFTAITDPAQIVGTRARYTIARGEPILSTMIVESLAQLSPFGSDAAAQIPPGYVGIAIPYDRTSGVAFGVKDGDHVNILVSWAIVDIDQDFQTVLPNESTVLSPPNPDATLPIPASLLAVVNSANQVVPNPVGRGEPGVGVAEQLYVVPSGPQLERLVSQSIVQDALVLHLGDFGENLPEVVQPTATPDPVATVPPDAVPTATPRPPDLITLAVPPQDALVLNYVNRLSQRYPGSVQVTLVLRSAGDTGRTETESVTLQYMFEQYNIALPAKLSYGVAPVAATATPAP
jgi:Flp pilus assembly protein CpaB